MISYLFILQAGPHAQIGDANAVCGAVMLRSPTMLRRGQEVMKLQALVLRQCASIANDHLDAIISVDKVLTELEISVC